MNCKSPSNESVDLPTVLSLLSYSVNTNSCDSCDLLEFKKGSSLTPPIWKKEDFDSTSK